MTIPQFQKIILKYYRENKRVLPWRNTHDPYRILVSEVMLQQTQVSRVKIKYQSFLKKFPTVQALAKASLADVLKEWQGLGYNRRAIHLKKCAEIIVKEYKGKFPKDIKTLCTLPGIGPATAGDLAAFAWDTRAVVIETNIRSVFIHFFFNQVSQRKKIHDKDILPLIEQTLPKKNIREWYYALFDYGTFLKQTSNPSRRSAHHLKQSTFIGSYRQKRAAVLRHVLLHPNKSTIKLIQKEFMYDTQTIVKILSDLQKEGFITRAKDGTYRIV
jgi:A/G-specific adenine glycosylase